MTDKAVVEFDLAAEDPRLRQDALLQAGNSLKMMRNFAGAIEKYMKALKHAADLNEAVMFRYQIATTLQEGGKLREALSLFQAINISHPSYLDVIHRILEIQAAIRASENG
jgi:tetratricopeptide (TPR) repeat protein